MPDDNPLKTTDEVAEIFRVTPQTVRMWIRENKFPNIVRPGRKYMIPMSDVLSLLNEQHGA